MQPSTSNHHLDARAKHQSMGPLHLGRPVDRRHSAMPLRSSPLAGPALSNDSTHNGKGKGKATLQVASAPASRSPSLTSLNSLASETLTSDLGSRSRRLSTKSFSGAFSRPEPSFTPNGNHANSSDFGTMDGLSERPPQDQHRSSSPIATPPGPKTSSAGDRRESWLISTPYDRTPRFSRLSLAAPGVVMPARKNTAARRPRSAGSGSVRSLGAPSLSSSISSRESMRDYPSTPNLVVTPPSPLVVDSMYVHEDEEAHGTHGGVVKGGELQKDRVERHGTIKKLWKKLSGRGR